MCTEKLLELCTVYLILHLSRIQTSQATCVVYRFNRVAKVPSEFVSAVPESWMRTRFNRFNHFIALLLVFVSQVLH